MGKACWSSEKARDQTILATSATRIRQRGQHVRCIRQPSIFSAEILDDTSGRQSLTTLEAMAIALGILWMYLQEQGLTRAEYNNLRSNGCFTLVEAYIFLSRSKD